MSSVKAAFRRSVIPPGRAGVQFVERLQRCRGMDTHAIVVGKIRPAHNACGIDQKFCRSGDVGAINPAVGMEQVPAPNHLGFCVAEEKKRVALLLTESPCDVRRVHADSNNAHTARRKLVEIVLETP